ncbi:MAG: hypothetical protein GX893_00030 [Firmicutes bacterium]|nr:hypothetical protein [Bacillota bacterium]
MERRKKDLYTLTDYILLNELVSDNYSRFCLQKIAVKNGLRLEDLYRAEQKLDGPLMSKDFASLIVQFLNQLGGGPYACQVNDGKKLELISYSCPFKHFLNKCPVLCDLVLNTLGSIAARNFPYCIINRISKEQEKSEYCQVIFYLVETAEARQAPGFICQPVTDVLSVSELQKMQAKLLAKDVQEQKMQCREMEIENQLCDVIFSDLRIGVLSVDSTNEVIYLNKAAEELLTKECWSSSTGQALKKVVADTIKNKKRYNQYLLQVSEPEGERYYSVNTAPLFSKKGVLDGAVCVFQDVTRTKKMENELLQLEKFSLLAELAAGTAHEIRNPITTMRGFLQILAQEFSPGSKGYEYCSLLIDEIDRVNFIIKEFLLLAKPAAPNLKKIDIHIILEEILLLIESKSLLEDVNIYKNLSARLPAVEADPAQIKQVFLNIATNAIQAMPNGGNLTITTVVDKDKVRVQFADTGTGMTEAQLKKIFNPFFTTKENGTGLGLTISYRIIERHNGRIFAESKPGEGTTFTIELPAVKG